MQISKEDKMWFFYSLKIGIIAGLLLGAGLFLVLENATPQFFLIGVIGIVMGSIFVVGAYATWAGLTKESLENMSVRVSQDLEKKY